MELLAKRAGFFAVGLERARRASDNGTKLVSAAMDVGSLQATHGRKAKGERQSEATQPDGERL